MRLNMRFVYFLVVTLVLFAGNVYAFTTGDIEPTKVTTPAVVADTVTAKTTDGDLTLSGNGVGSVIITLIDVSGGEIDDTVIGANTPAAGTFTDVVAETLTTSGAPNTHGIAVTDNASDGGIPDGSFARVNDVPYHKTDLSVLEELARDGSSPDFIAVTTDNITESTADAGVNIESVHHENGFVQNSYWKDKTILWSGTSISEEGVSTSNSFPDLAGDELGATLTNSAVDSSHTTWEISPVDATCSGNNRVVKGMSATVAELQAKIDAATGADDAYCTTDGVTRTDCTVACQGRSDADVLGYSYENIVVGADVDLIMFEHGHNDRDEDYGILHETFASITNLTVVSTTLTVDTTSAHELSVGDDISIREKGDSTGLDSVTGEVVTVTDTDTFTMTIPSGSYSNCASCSDAGVADYDKTNFFESFNFILRATYFDNPDVLIGFVSPPSKFSQGLTTDETIIDIRDALIRLGSKYGTPVYDMTDIFGLNDINIATWFSDGTHPDLTARTYIGRNIAGWLSGGMQTNGKIDIEKLDIDGSPDAASDYIVSHDVSDNKLKKVSLADIITTSASDLTSGNLPVAQLPTGGAWALSSDLNIDSDTLVIDNDNPYIGIGDTTPDAFLDINPSGTISVPSFKINATDANNTYGLEIIGKSGGVNSVKIQTGNNESRLRVVAGDNTENAPLFSLIGSSDAAIPGWALFDFGSNLLNLSAARFQTRYNSLGGGTVTILEALTDQIIAFPVSKVGFGFSVSTTPDGQVEIDAASGNVALVIDSNDTEDALHIRAADETVLAFFDDAGRLSAKVKENVEASTATLTALEIMKMMNNDGQSADMTLSYPAVTVDNDEGSCMPFWHTEEVASGIDTFLKAPTGVKFILDNVTGSDAEYICLPGTSGQEKGNIVTCCVATSDGDVDIFCKSPDGWIHDDDNVTCDGL